MKFTHSRNHGPITLGLALLLVAGLASAADVTLSGDNEVPPVHTAASGNSSISIADDGTVAGSVHTTQIAGTVAHIHLGAKGKNGPVLIALTKGTDGDWQVPAGSKLTTEQLKSFKAGDLYVNVHSQANKGGEIRTQLAP